MLKFIKYATIASLCFTPMLFQQDVAQAGGFSLTCRDALYLRGAWGVMFAHCRKNDHSWRMRAAIRLGGIIANDNGVLNWRRNGGFNGSCFNIRVNRDPVTRAHILLACCRRRGGDCVPAAINLNDRITNLNGFLVPDRSIPR